MKIDWKSRFKNKMFWMTFLPALLVLVQAAAGLFGISPELKGIEENILSVVNALFAVLALLGVVNNPTTKGLSDSGQSTEKEVSEDR